MMQIYVVCLVLRFCTFAASAARVAVPHHALPGHHDTWLTVMARGRDALWNTGLALQWPKPIHEQEYLLHD